MLFYISSPVTECTVLTEKFEFPRAPIISFFALEEKFAYRINLDLNYSFSNFWKGGWGDG